MPGEGPETKQTALTRRARRLYEETAVPVAEIARLCGVTERTLYKYARKGGWKPRYAWVIFGSMPGTMLGTMRAAARGGAGRGTRPSRR